MLTRQQYRLLTYIRQRFSQTGVSTSFEEMKGELGLKSKSGIHRLILGLEERGFINRLPNRARALEVIKLPDNAVENVPSKVHPLPKKNNTKQGVGTTKSTQRVVTVPLLGQSTAATPIETVRDKTGQIDIPTHLVTIGEHFALEVDGDSMIEAGIFDKDIVIVRRDNMADTGAIIIALIDKQEITIKRLRKRGDSIALEPANKHYETRIFGPDRVHIEGKVVGLIRRYE